MTEQEAKVILDVRISRFDHAEDVNEALEIAKQALEEIQQYRKIGTVEECRTLASIVNKVERNELAKIIDEWLEYSKIGTVEECQEAREKQAQKDLEFRGDGEEQLFLCPNCGQNIQWDEIIMRRNA